MKSANMKFVLSNHFYFKCEKTAYDMPSPKLNPFYLKGMGRSKTAYIITIFLVLSLIYIIIWSLCNKYYKEIFWERL